MTKIGPTGQYPDGKLAPDDHGELAIGFAIDPATRTIIIRFGQLISWVGLTADAADELAAKLTDMARRART
jgi:hypothetical protein